MFASLILFHVYAKVTFLDMKDNGPDFRKTYVASSLSIFCVCDFYLFHLLETWLGSLPFGHWSH